MPTVVVNGDKGSIPASPPPTPPSRCFLQHCNQTFAETTSIRGITRLHQVPSRPLRIFWIIYIAISIITALAMATYCLLQYLQRQTVLAQSQTTMQLRDFPAVTVCSQMHFGSTPSSLWLLDHHRKFLDHLASIMNGALALEEYKLIMDFLDASGSEPLFNINNLAMHARVADEFLHNSNESDLMPRCRTSQSQGRCNISNLVNARFRNCLQFQLEWTKRAVSVEELTILVPLVASSQNGTKHFGPITVYLHDRRWLPTWELPAAQEHVSVHSSLRLGFRVEVVDYMRNGPHACESTPSTIRHAGRNYSADVSTCRRRVARDLVRQRCGCECWWPPLEEWPVRADMMCGYLGESPTGPVLHARLARLRCMQQEEAVALSTAGSDSCPRPCRRRQYRSTIYSEPLSGRGVQRFISLGRVERLLSGLEACRSCRAAMNCTSECDTAVNDTNYVRQYLSQQFSPTDLFPTTLPSSCTGAACDASPAVTSPPTSTPVIRYALLKVAPNSELVDFYKERLIHSLWVTFAQSGGACSFFAGLTFTVFAELVDSIVTALYLRKKPHEVGDVAPAVR